ncbi:MAG: FecR domain-containing protein [Verrucomicrobia bacterium]|nr:FecR domain-containing protein [Verrucomicrobiota bacterium]MDA1068362.1 FecR domain-containing protein [Verrucomicrobiota bacterium]
MTPDERNQLIDELLDATISEADFLRLEAEMRVNPEARQDYYNRLKLHSALKLEAQRIGAGSVVSPNSFWKKHSYSLGVAAAIAMFVLVGISGWGLGKSGVANQANDSEPVAAGYAILADQSEAVWLEDTLLERGDLLPQGSIKLGSGIAQLEFFSGVSVVIEGESEFEIHSPMEMTVSKGKIRALVPEAARGFKVLTSSGEVVDLGTEFALDVSPNGAEIQVFQGEVEWYPIGEEKYLLADGETMQWTKPGQSMLSSKNTKSVSSVEEYGHQFYENRLERQNSWVARSERLSEDPRVLAYYPVKSGEVMGRQLNNDAGSNSQGTIVGARRVADRWGLPAGALNFSPAGSRVRVSIPGEHSSLTFYCWARIDSLDRLYNSLFLTDGHELNEPHWQIMNDGRLFFSVKRRDRDEAKNLNDKHIAYSPSFWDPSKSGKWFQIATVYDVGSQTTTHYVNGQQISRDQISDEYAVDTVKIGAASIGNWNEPTRGDPQFALRNLNGAIDEFTIFNAALSSEEISDLYTQGRP